MHTFITEAYEGGIRSSLGTLGKHDYKLPPQWEALSNWFCALPDTDRANAIELIRMVADGVAFQCCCVLDNLKLTPLGDRKITFSLCAEEHIPKKNATRFPAAPVRINDPNRLELLHDHFRSLVKIWPDVGDDSTTKG